MKTKIPGLLLCIAIAITAKILSYSLAQIGSVSLAIILGILFANIIKLGKQYESGVNYAEAFLLPVAIVFMGAKLRLDGVQSLGVSPLYTVLPPMLIAIVSSIFIGKLLKLPVRESLLLGVGNSVCGASAAVSASGVLRTNKEALAVTISSVNLMGTVGLFFVPAFSHLFNMSDGHSSFLIGGSLQAVGQVVAAGYSMSSLIGENAVLLKMLRVAMIGPIVLILSFIFCPNCGGKRRFRIPLYVLGFMLLAFLGSFLADDSVFIRIANILSSYLMLIAMAGIGLKISLSGLLAHGGKALLMVFTLSVIQFGSLLFFMRFYN